MDTCSCVFSRHLPCCNRQYVFNIRPLGCYTCWFEPRSSYNALYLKICNSSVCRCVLLQREDELISLHWNDFDDNLLNSHRISWSWKDREWDNNSLRSWKEENACLSCSPHHIDLSDHICSDSHQYLSFQNETCIPTYGAMNDYLVHP